MAKTLQDWMDRKKLKDPAVAELVGISRFQIARIRKGKSKASLETARKLEAVTRIPASRFVMGDAGQPEAA